MYLEIQQLNCCAVREIAGLDTGAKPKAILKELCRDNQGGGWAGLPPAFFIFTQAGRGEYGVRLARYIRKHRLGELVKSKGRKNPRTGNRVVVWVWAVNPKSLSNWAIDNVKAYGPEGN